MATTKKSTSAKSKSTKPKSSTAGGAKTKSKAASSKSSKSPSSKATPKKGTAKTAARSTKSTTSNTKSTKKAASKAPAAAKKKTTATSRSKSTSSKSKAKSSDKGLIATAIDAVAGLFKPGSPDAIELLETDHRKVEDLFEKVKANEDGNNQSTFKKIKQELDVHAHIEETIFYPHLLDNGDKELKKIVREGIEEHGQVKDLLVELATLSGTSPTFKAKLTVLMENVEHHVKEEEGDMFPMVRDQIDAEMLQRIGSLMYGEKVKVGKKSPPAKAKKAAAASRG